MWCSCSKIEQGTTFGCLLECLRNGLIHGTVGLQVEIEQGTVDPLVEVEHKAEVPHTEVNAHEEGTQALLYDQ